jgi:DNA-binding transcriptional MerR regulator
MQAIGTAARLSGVHIETIRYYERAGILPEAERAASGRRLYDAAAIARLRFVKRCRDLGFSLADIRSLLALVSGQESSEGACEQVRRIGIEHLSDVRAKLADLAQLESALTALLHQCDSDRTECPALRQLFDD